MEEYNIRMKNAATVKKTYNLPAPLIERVRRFFKVRTETEAIIRALEEIAFMERVDRAMKETSGAFPRFKPLR